MKVTLDLTDAQIADLLAQLQPAGGYRAPAPVPRSSVLYFGPGGSDGNPGSADRPKRSFMQAVLARAVPNGCAIKYLGDLDVTDPQGVFSSYGGLGVPIPTDLTFMPAGGYGSATLRGRRAGNAFTLVDAGPRRWQVCGLKFTGFADPDGNGTVVIDGDTADVDVDGCQFSGNGSGNTNQDHGLYLGGGSSFGTAPRRIRIRGNLVDEPGNSGFWLHVYDQRTVMAHDVLIEGNSVAWTGCGAGLFTANFRAPANWTVQGNDLRVFGDRAVSGSGTVMPTSVLDFYDPDQPPASTGGVDSTFVVRDNLLALVTARADSAYPGMPCVAIRTRLVTPPHQPTRGGNRLFVPAGHQAVVGAALGADAQIQSLPARLAVLPY